MLPALGISVGLGCGALGFWGFGLKGYHRSAFQELRSSANSSAGMEVHVDAVAQHLNRLFASFILSLQPRFHSYLGPPSPLSPLLLHPVYTARERCEYRVASWIRTVVGDCPAIATNTPSPLNYSLLLAPCHRKKSEHSHTGRHHSSRNIDAINSAA